MQSSPNLNNRNNAAVGCGGRTANLVVGAICKLNVSKRAIVFRSKRRTRLLLLLLLVVVVLLGEEE